MLRKTFKGVKELVPQSALFARQRRDPPNHNRENEYWCDVFRGAFEKKYFEFCKLLKQLITEFKSLKHNLTRRTILSHNLDQLIAMEKFDLLADSDIIGELVRDCGWREHIKRSKNRRKRGYLFYQHLFRQHHVVIPSDLFTKPRWMSCSVYSVVKALVLRGAKPESGGIMLGRFPKKEKELRAIGFL